MNKFGIAAIAASAVAAMLLGLGLGGAIKASTTALAPVPTIATGIEHHHSIEDFQPTVTVPNVDTSVRRSGR